MLFTYYKDGQSVSFDYSVWNWTAKFDGLPDVKSIPMCNNPIDTRKFVNDAMELYG